MKTTQFVFLSTIDVKKNFTGHFNYKNDCATVTGTLGVCGIHCRRWPVHTQWPRRNVILCIKHTVSGPPSHYCTEIHLFTDNEITGRRLLIVPLPPYPEILFAGYVFKRLWKPMFCNWTTITGRRIDGCRDAITRNEISRTPTAVERRTRFFRIIQQGIQTIFSRSCPIRFPDRPIFVR